MNGMEVPTPMPETPRALPKLELDVAAELERAAGRFEDMARASDDAALPEIREALNAAFARFDLLRDCEAPAEEVAAAARAVARLATRAATHADADEEAPRAIALERAAVALRAVGVEGEARSFYLEAADRWLDAADDDRARAKEFLLRASDAFAGGFAFDRAAGSYARAITIGEDRFEPARSLPASAGAHRLKLALLLIAAEKIPEARAVNDALTEELTNSFEKKVARADMEAAFDRARALSEAHALAGTKAGERQARTGAVDLALALVKRDAKDGAVTASAAESIAWANAAVTESLRTRDDALFIETWRRAARAVAEAALALLSDASRPQRCGEGVRLLFEAGRRFQLAGDEEACDECTRRAFEVSPKYSPGDRRPLDEAAFGLFLLKGRRADPEQAEVHLRNAQSLAKALIQAAGVSEDHPSARLRQLAFREAFYRRKGDLKRHRETLDIMAVAAAEGAADALNRAAGLYRLGKHAPAAEAFGEALAYLERAGGDEALLRRALHMRSLCHALTAATVPVESAASLFARRQAPFDPAALGYEWPRIERALSEMDPPAEFATARDALQFIKGRAQKGRAPQRGALSS